MKKPKTQTLDLELEQGVPTIIQSIEADEFYNMQRRRTIRNIFGSSSVDINGFMSDFVFRCLLSPDYKTAEELRSNILPGQYMDLMNAVSEINGFETDKK